MKFLFTFLPLILIYFIGCRPNYFLVHPLQTAPEIYRESGMFDRGQLRVYWLARYADRKEPLPAVLVHPDRGSFSEDMEGICLALAQRGYFAASAHYQRVENLNNKNPLIPWRSPNDVTAALEHLQKHPLVNPAQIAVMGYSRGAIVSLQIASLVPSVKAVVAYYPLADFEEWLDVEKYSFPKSLLFRWVRKQLVKEAGASSFEEARPQFRKTSPIRLVSQIQAPVLLIHGEKDRTFPIDQAQRLYRALQSAGNPCEFLVVRGAGHVFNFRDKEKGKMAWEKTVQFLDRHLQ
jgi:dienelactone hydrolase